MKLVIDMNLSTDWASSLTASGFDGIHWSKVGAGDAADDDIISWAQKNGACVLTRDLDFAAAITRSGSGSPSVIQLRIGRVQLEQHLPLVRRCLTIHAEPLEQGAIVTLDEERIRVRILDRDASR